MTTSLQIAPRPLTHPESDALQRVLTPEALLFVESLEREFGKTRRELLEARKQRQARIDQGNLPGFLAETESVRKSEWRVRAIPADLQDRKVEITGPAEAKMMINALNSGAKVFMADIEDALSPTWKNVVEGQAALQDAVRRVLKFKSPEGKSYSLNEKIATLVVRPRGWHLDEKHVTFNGAPISGSLFDFGLYFFHNASEALKRGTGPYYYLPKMESHLEARLWADVFRFSEKKLGIPSGSIAATVLIETAPAGLVMEEILFELKDYIVALNAGRWDYLFSAIKTYSTAMHDWVTPDRGQLTMTVPFMRAYSELLVKTCHKRGAFAMGGMAAFIPSRRDAEINANALTKVKEDKNREVGDGFDGTWVAHPDLVPVALDIFEGKLQGRANQADRQRNDVHVEAGDLRNFRISNSKITEAGVRLNINVALQYIERWLSGVGAAAIHNLMEDAATAEISRAQLWQWVQRGARTEDTGQVITAEYYSKLKNVELETLGGTAQGRMKEAVQVLDSLVFAKTFPDFLTLEAYRYL